MQELAVNLGIDVLFKGTNFIRLLGGLWTALWISLVSVAISIPLGIGMGVLMTKKNRILKAVLRVYLEFIRIMPQLVLLFIMFFGTTRAFGWDLSGEAASIIVFVLWGTAEMGDLVRGALISIPKHQYESSEALGLTTAHTAFDKSDNKNDKDDKPYPYDRCCRGSEGRTADNRS